ncbi:MAG: radical SAM protein [Synergistaceae bacterium]|jgi:MoaA/NifB/PqqE/SkfB family radical SAM enzyme|nr:radical SAM protein [Synergistaceae bacterium]
MINLSKLLMPDQHDFPGDAIRFGVPRSPVIVWHITGRCNLRCRHCYSSSDDAPGSIWPGELDDTEARLFLASLPEIAPPTLLFSGGEPLVHPNFFSYIKIARGLGLNVSISTNGTLIDAAAAAKIAAAGVSYVGVSLDGVRDENDDFRGREGAFDEALNGIKALSVAGRQDGRRIGLRVTLASPVLRNLDSLLALALDLPVSRICFYHFIPSGRGALDPALMPEPFEERRAIERIISWADGVCASRASRGEPPMEILTVGDASDGVLAYKYLLDLDRSRADYARAFLVRSASKRGAGILSVRWDGLVFENQFSWDRPLGTWDEVFTRLAGGMALPLLRASRHGAPVGCGWEDICSGSLRDFCSACGDVRAGVGHRK